ncbi:hypothetical protein DL93DRAFT_2227429 [Clavulina sp. PMI_390]|nr:hypothetical protein DL93DRAFT_2227429 [Clavulina sp. PMI_390]
MQSEEQLLQEISRLKTAINRHQHPDPSSGATKIQDSRPAVSRQPQNIIINGAVFRSSARSLVRQSPQLAHASTSSDSAASASSTGNSTVTNSSATASRGRLNKSTLIASHRFHPHRSSFSLPTPSSSKLRGGVQNRGRTRGSYRKFLARNQNPP